MIREELIRQIQQKYQQTGESLNELQRRHWAAAEAIKLGRGGITAVSKALQMSPNTIKRGMQELASGDALQGSQSIARIRKSGGGRKPKRRDVPPRSPAPDTSATNGGGSSLPTL